eukprot:TRINITY_DN13286_c0_g1_i1.p1 TRINITY_DN13286_c0_g1~~TRINITY_DN13286_c0_g1_i1.p1  ORF type:complete len:176 (-),score=22.13 TRINITY_DN13286_c0_g1_i1:307-834(-)
MSGGTVHMVSRLRGGTDEDDTPPPGWLEWNPNDGAPNPTGAPGVSLQVATLTGKRVQLDQLNENSTIWDLKYLVQCFEGIPPSQQRLIFAGKQLEDSRTFADYNMTADNGFARRSLDTLCADLDRVADEMEAPRPVATVHMVCRMLGDVNGRHDLALASTLSWDGDRLARNGPGA